MPPGHAYRYYRFRVLKVRSGWTDAQYSPGGLCTGCCLGTGLSIAEFQLFQDSVEVIALYRRRITLMSCTFCSKHNKLFHYICGRWQVNPQPIPITIVSATSPGTPIVSTPVGNAIDGDTSTVDYCSIL